MRGCVSWGRRSSERNKGSSALHAADDSHDFFDVFLDRFGFFGLEGLDDAVFHVFFQDHIAHGLQCCAGGLNLRDDIDAVLFLFNHSPDTVDLSFDTGESVHIFFMCRLLVFHGVNRSILVKNLICR